MRSGPAAPADVVADGAGRAISHHSPALTVVTAAPGRVQTILDELTGTVGADGVRYSFSGGAGRFTRPVWGFGHDLPGAEPPTELTITLGMVQCRERREAAIDREAHSIRAWLDAGGGARRALVLETRGTPSQEDVAFWQACRLRLARHAGGRQSIVVVLHDRAPRDTAVPSGRAADELLIALHLAGDHAFAPELHQWSRARGWSPDLVAALTETRQTRFGTMHTYAATVPVGQAGAVFRAAEPGLVAELAALVIAAQRVPSLAAAALLTDPATALAAFSGHGSAEVAHTERGLSRYAGNLHRRARTTEWANVSRHITAAAYVAAVAAERRQGVSPAVASALVACAEAHGVGARARGALGYTLGQQLVRAPGTRAAGVRMFEYVRRCHATVATGEESRGSQLAASFNGAALAQYRGGFLDVAAETMRSGLEALRNNGSELRDQQVLLLTNLAKVHRRKAETRRTALAEYRAAWEAALAADSVPAVCYVAADLVHMLTEEREIAEAETVGREVLRRYDLAHESARARERSVVAACCHLADAHLAAGAAQEAAEWYLAAAHRMRRGGPEVIDAIITNLRGRPSPELLAELSREREAQRLLTADLAALRTCLTEATP